MKIRHVWLSNFKRFESERHFSFVDNQDVPNSLNLLLGDNGTGKSTLLQAIALILAPVLRDRFRLDQFDWPGFDRRGLRSGSRFPTIRAEIAFSSEERLAIAHYAEQLNRSGRRVPLPADVPVVSLVYDWESGQTIAEGGPGHLSLLHGYQNAKRLSKQMSGGIALFEKVGNIYWYTEQRNANSVFDLTGKASSNLDDLRNFLSSAYNFHMAITLGKQQMRPGQFDFFERLKLLYERVFPGRTLMGPAPSFDQLENAKAPDFFLNDGNADYELSGLSAGERAIFPILMDFTRWNINHSIILVDEVELHLHPPLQQDLIRALARLGNENQFFFTSHSRAVLPLFDEDARKVLSN